MNARDRDDIGGHVAVASGHVLLFVLLAKGVIGTLLEDRRRERNACAFVSSHRATPALEEASAEELAALKAIGPRLAHRIVSFRAVVGGLDHRGMALIPGLGNEALEEIEHSMRMATTCPR